MTTETVKERPILFSGPMVRAILDGRKTQTRRIIKPQPAEKDGWFSHEGYTAGSEKAFREGMPFFSVCPYGSSGERLWVREAFCASFKPMIYRASATADTYGGKVIKYKPSIHMPRRMSRIDLEITGVRVERLNEISEEDCYAEGIRKIGDGGAGELDGARSTPRQLYSDLWVKINGPGSWAANPWVWVVEFKTIG
jgi:hypothetical protein